jgi:hypothetical protein
METLPKVSNHFIIDNSLSYYYAMSILSFYMDIYKHSYVSFQHIYEFITKNMYLDFYGQFFFIDGPGSNISFNPAHESITKNLNGSVGPIVCFAPCNPPCQFSWITPDGSVVAGSNLTIPSLSKNDHGTFICHAGNGFDIMSQRITHAERSSDCPHGLRGCTPCQA